MKRSESRGNFIPKLVVKTFCSFCEMNVLKVSPTWSINRTRSFFKVSAFVMRKMETPRNVEINMEESAAETWRRWWSARNPPESFLSAIEVMRCFQWKAISMGCFRQWSGVLLCMEWLIAVGFYSNNPTKRTTMAVKSDDSNELSSRNY